MVIEWIRGWYRPIVFNCSFVTLNIFLFSSVLIRVFQRNRTMYFHMRSFMIGIGSCSYGDCKVLSLLSASWRTRKAGNSIQSEFTGLRIEGGGHISGREYIHPSSAFLCYSSPHQIGWCPAALVRAIVTQSTDPNANISQRPLHKHNHKECLTSNLDIGGPVKLMYKINHHCKPR